MALSKRMNSVNEPYDTSDRNSFLKIVVVRAAEEEEVWNKKSHQEDAMGGRSATNNFNSHQQLLPKTAPSSAPHTGCPKKRTFRIIIPVLQSIQAHKPGLQASSSLVSVWQPRDDSESAFFWDTLYSSGINAVWAGTFRGFLNVSLRTSGAQLGFDSYSNTTITV